MYKNPSAARLISSALRDHGRANPIESVLLVLPAHSPFAGLLVSVEKVAKLCEAVHMLRRLAKVLNLGFGRIYLRTSEPCVIDGSNLVLR